MDFGEKEWMQREIRLAREILFSLPWSYTKGFFP
jgi:hypothetical protein